MAASTVSEQSRSLDNLEQRFTQRVINNCGMMLEIDVEESHQVDMELLRRAVTETQLRHPNLRACPDAESKIFRPVSVAQENFQVL